MLGLPAAAAASAGTGDEADNGNDWGHQGPSLQCSPG